MELGFYDIFTSYQMEVETHVHEQKPTRVSRTTNCMLSLGLRSYEMELGSSDLFTSYEMKLSNTHVHEHIENQLGFHEL